MASYKKTITSADIGQEPTRSTADVQIDSEQARAASLWANPQQLLAGLPKPGAFQSAVNAGLMGLKAGQAIPTATPEVAALTGALTGLGSQMPFEQAYQQNAMGQIDMLPIEQVSPALVQAFPEAQGIPLGIFQKLSGIFSAMGKQKAQAGDVLDESDIPAIRLTLKTKGYEDNEIEDAMPGLMGQTWGVIKGLSPKTRTARAQAVQDVIPDSFGIPVKFLETDKVSGRKIEKESKSNVAVSNKLSDIGKGKSILDQLYSEMFALNDAQRTELAAAARARGGILSVLGKPGFGGETGERVRNMQRIIEANIPLIARSLGHTGVLTELDVLKSFGVTPEIGQSVRELEYRKGLVDKLIGANISNTVRTATPLLGVGIDYNILANSMNLPVDYIRNPINVVKKEGQVPQPKVAPKKQKDAIDKALDDIFK